MPDGQIAERIAAWQQAGVIDAETAARIEAFEGARPAPARAPSGRITVSEVIAYIGTVVLLVGVGFLYGTEYRNLGTPGRLVLIGLVAVAGYAAGELLRRLGATAAARRARAAGWSVGALATTAGLAQLFVDNNIATRRPQFDFPGAPPDASGSALIALLAGTLIAAVLLWRAGAGLLAFVLAGLTYAASFALLSFLRIDQPGWRGEAAFLVPAAILAAYAEVVGRGQDRRWAREVLRFAALLVPMIVALVLSSQPDDSTLELFAAALALLGFGLAFVRASAGYAISAGIGLFVVINEVGFRHFSNTLGFPVVLIISGIALFVIAGGLVGLLRRERPASEAPDNPPTILNGG